MAITFIALGSNLDDPKKHITLALQQLQHLPQTTVISASALYATPPMGNMPQPHYINAVAKLETTLLPMTLLDELIKIEQQHNRHRNGTRWAARTLDLDIVLYDNQAIQLPLLTVPHPGLTTRAFVLVPLLEIAPDACLPDGTRLADCLIGLKTDDIVLL